MFETPITARTRYCAVFGHPVRHSASPPMQNAGLAALGLDWRYLAFEVRPERLQSALEGARRMQFIGINLTVPHKLLAVNMMDILDASAREWGAVNTVRFEAPDSTGQWRPLGELEGEIGDEIRAHGFNTDADAIVQALHDDLGVTPSGASVLVLGAGGAGRVAALKLAAEGAAVMHIYNRTESKAVELADEIRRRFPEVKVTPGLPDGKVDLVLNATSVGLKAGDGLPVAADRLQLRRAGAVYDMIYRPAETPLLKAARAAGCRTANGLGMLLYQGARALELWTGRPAPLSVMREALFKSVYGDSNGKS